VTVLGRLALLVDGRRPPGVDHYASFGLVVA
jgi:hypothetical protein